MQQAILYFDNDRYWLSAWCVMPNHVHVLVTPQPGHELSTILHSWKSFTSTEINRLLAKSGPLWERESFNHLLRKPEHIDWFTQYIHDNPVAAGLCERPQQWPHSSCGAGFQPARIRFVAPNETPFVSPRSRGELPHLHKDAGTYFVTWRLLDAVETGMRD